MAATHISNFASTADANPQVISLAGKTNGRDLFVLAGAGATLTVSSPWEELSPAGGLNGGGYVLKLFHLPAGANTSSITSLSISLNASRALSAVVWEDDLAGTPNLYWSGADGRWPSLSTPGDWGTGLHTFTQRDEAFAFYYGQTTLSGSFDPALDISGYDGGFTEFGDTGISQGSIQSRLWLAHHPTLAESSNGVTATTTTARTNAFDFGGAGMFAYNVGPPPPPDPTLARSPATLSFTAEEAGTAPATKTVSVTNAGTGGTVNFTVSDDATWLTVSPTSGTAPQTLTVSCNPAGLIVGSHTATITITAAGVAGSPQTVAVNFEITAAPPPPAAPNEFHVLHNGDWVRLDIGSSPPSEYVYERPEAYGAKRDCKSLKGASITNGDNTLTVPGASFAAGDVGKKVILYKAGASANQGVLNTTIASVTDAENVELSLAASATITSGRGAYGTDDQDAINAAIATAVQRAQENKTNFAKVFFSAGQYLCSKPPIKGGTAKGNAQIELPAINPTLEKVTLELVGPGNPTGWLHWDQLVPADNGAVIRSAMAAEDFDSTWGAPSVIGGPGPTLDWGIDATINLSNMLLVMDGIKILTPPNPCMTAVNLKGLAQMNIPTLQCQVDSVVAYQNPVNIGIDAEDYPVNTNGLGLAAPAFGNNANNILGSYGCQGFYYGISPTDHFTAQRLALVYCNTGIVIVNFAATAQHGISIQSASIEAAATLIEVLGGSGGKLPIFISDLNTETGGPDTDFKDSGGQLHGVIYYAHNSSTKPSVDGCANVQIYDLNQARGAVTAPGVPSSTTALVNPFFRDATVYVSGGTVSAIAVDGQNLGITSGMVLVPTGKSITLTYSSAPTWNWIVL